MLLLVIATSSRNLRNFHCDGHSFQPFQYFITMSEQRKLECSCSPQRQTTILENNKHTISLCGCIVVVCFSSRNAQERHFCQELAVCIVSPMKNGTLSVFPGKTETYLRFQRFVFVEQDFISCFCRVQFSLQVAAVFRRSADVDSQFLEKKLVVHSQTFFHRSLRD